MEPINSWDQLQAVIGDIVDALNANSALVRAAAVNPLLALEELGYELTPEARNDVEERLRFEPRQVVRRRELRALVFREAGKTFDLNEPGALYEVLFDDLGLSPSPDERGCYPPLPDTSPLPPQLSYHEPVEDPLEVLRGRHPIMGPLLAYRRLEASKPQFATRALYAEVRQGKRTLGITRVHARLKEPAGPTDGPDGGADGPDGGAGGPTVRPQPHRTTSPDTGRVDVNTASQEDLTSLPGIGPALAARIVEYREKHGPFVRPEALKRVRGISDAMLQKIRRYVSTGRGRA